MNNTCYSCFCERTKKKKKMEEEEEVELAPFNNAINLFFIIWKSRIVEFRLDWNQLVGANCGMQWFLLSFVRCLDRGLVDF